METENQDHLGQGSPYGYTRIPQRWKPDFQAVPYHRSQTPGCGAPGLGWRCPRDRQDLIGRPVPKAGKEGAHCLVPPGPTVSLLWPLTHLF